MNILVERNKIIILCKYLININLDDRIISLPYKHAKKAGDKSFKSELQSISGVTQANININNSKNKQYAIITVLKIFANNDKREFICRIEYVDCVENSIQDDRNGGEKKSLG